MPGHPQASEDRLLLALTTEHFTLQTARSATIAESNGRVLIFLSTLSSSVVALAFVGQSTAFGTPFYVFAFAIFPAMLIVGFATFMRALQTGVEDAFFALAINRIRAHYIKLHPDAESLLLLPTAGTIKSIRAESLAERTPSRLQALFTAAGMVACVEGLVAGAFAALLLDRLTHDAGEWAVGVGVATALVVGASLLYYGRQYFFRALGTVGVASPWERMKQPPSA